MSCIELYRGDLCHFHFLSIENIADFVTCSSIRAVCVCVCVWGGGVMGWTNSFQNQADWEGGEVELANVAPLWTNYFKKSSRF